MVAEKFHFHGVKITGKYILRQNIESVQFTHDPPR